MKIKRILIFIFLLFVLSSVAFAAEDDSSVFDEQFKASGAEELFGSLPGDTGSTLSDLGINPETPASIGSVSPGNVFEVLINSFYENLTSPLTSGILALSFLLVCSVFISLKPSNSLSGIAEYICALFLSAAVVTPIVSSVLRASQVVEECGNFMTAFVPVYSGILLCSGKAASAASYQTLIFGAAEIITVIGRTFIVPLCGMFLALCIASGIAPNVGISGIISAIKKAAFFILTLSMTIFTAIITITGGINTASDSVSQRTAKFFVGSFVPVVGGVLSDALGSVQGYLLVLRSSVGIFGAAAIAVILLPSLVELILWRIMLSLTAAAAEILGFTSSVTFFNSVGSAVSFMLSVVVCVGSLFLVSFAILFLTGGTV